MEAAPTPEEYQYNPLDPTHPSIRLLEVDAGDGVITCRLTHHALDACPPYSTLSYTWGSTVATHSIVCSGSILRIGANLHDFLTQFQTFPRNRRPLLWVDAICINQSDIPERNDQVLRMRDIYSNAERVLVWLGPEDEDTELVFDVLDWSIRIKEQAKIEQTRLHPKVVHPRISSYDGRRIEPRDEEPRASTHSSLYLGDSPQEIHGRLIGGLMRFEMKHWHALYSLLSRPYWTRVWIIQELYLSAEAEVYCGPFRIPLSIFHDLADQIELNRALFGGKTGWLNATGWWLMLQRKRWRLKNGSGGGDRPMTLENLLQIHHAAQSTDPLDRIYALLGLITDVHERKNVEAIIPDYGKSPVQLLVEVFRLYSQSPRECSWTFNLLAASLNVSRRDLGNYVRENEGYDDLLQYMPGS